MTDARIQAAERVLAAHGHAGATDHDIARYWSRLIEANRAGLVDPANPDLVFRGQELVLPAP